MGPISRVPLPYIAAGALSAASLALEFGLGGRTGVFGEPGFFLGRFHPLAVHLPIGILLLAVAFEGAATLSKEKTKYDTALTLALGVTAVSAFGSLLLGHLLAQEGGVAEQAVRMHRRLALAATLGTALTFAVFLTKTKSSGKRSAYRIALGATVVLLSLGAHIGGGLSRGDGYLAKYAPPFLAPLLGGTASTALPESFKPAPKAQGALLYSDAIEPLLKKYCVECHGPEKAKGKLRLDSVAAMQKGGEGGPAVDGVHPEKSLLLGRMRLPPNNDEHMPPTDKPQLSEGEIGAIEMWLRRGASVELSVDDVLPSEPTLLYLRTLRGSAQPPHEQSAPLGTEPSPRTPSEKPEPEPASIRNSEASSRPQSGRELLLARCASCHGPTKQKGKLRVDSKEALLTGGKSGPALSLENPREGILLKRMDLPTSSDEHMPPSEEPQFTSQEAAVVRAYLLALSKSGSSASSGSKKETGNEPQQQVSAPEPDWHGKWGRPLFDQAVSPLFQKKCTSCHDENLASGGLRLDTFAEILKGGDSGAAVLFTNTKKSELHKRITLPLKNSDHMPPKDYEALTADEVKLVRFWIEHALDPATSVLPDWLTSVTALSPSTSAKPESAAEKTASVSLPGGASPGDASPTATSSPLPQSASIEEPGTAPPATPSPPQRGILGCAYQGGTPRLEWPTAALLGLLFALLRRGSRSALRRR